MKQKTIFTFTGGGLSPSLNSTLAGVIGAAQKKKWRVLGGRQGWASLLPGGKYQDVSHLDVAPLKTIGGTFLQTSRTHPLKYPGGRRYVADQIKKLGVDAVVAIGGDDTLSAAQQLYLEEGLPIFGIPKTIDNDIPGNYFTPGFPSAAECLGEMVCELKYRAAYALSRIYVVEAMGLHSGWLTAAGCLGDADLLVPPERPVNFDNFFKVLQRRYKANNGFALVVVSQEAHFTGGVTGQADDQADDYAVSRHQFICLGLKKIIKDRLGIDTKAILVGNLLESGDPNLIDQKMSGLLGQSVIDQIAKDEAPSIALIRKNLNKKIVVQHRAWHEVDLDNAPALSNKYFDFQNFQIKKSLRDYFQSMGLTGCEQYRRRFYQ